jgi:dienelactone hydrolase
MNPMMRLPDPARVARGLAAALLGVACLLPVRGQTVAPAVEALARDMHEEVVRIKVTVSDMYGRQETRAMPITVYRPTGDGPFPLVVFNHGRATVDRRAAQGRYRPEQAARYLVAKGFVVLVPTRIGYWETYGDFDPEQSGPCNARRLEPMTAAASDQVLATVQYASTQPYIDTTRWLVIGISVGGLTSIGTVARHPPGLLGGINFSGGTGGDPVRTPGRPCSPAQVARHWGELARQAKAPMLWLYWQNDKYWGEEIPKTWHKAWVDGGGQAEFVSLAPAGEDGHLGLVNDMQAWLPLVDAFLARLGFDRPAIVGRPPASRYAELGDASKVPINAQSKATGYAQFLQARLPRAFAVGVRGAWGYASGDYAVGKALGYCQRSGQACQLYAVDNDVVWRPN